MSGGKTFVGFGFGPIQSGLFLFEAYASGNFSRFVVAEVDKNLVASIRANSGRCGINVARHDGIDARQLEGIELYDPADPADRQALLAAIAESDELATALPAVRFYDAGGQNSVASLLATGLSARTSPRPSVIYAAENHNHAAEILRADILKHAAPSALEGVGILNTVIGKMSGVIAEPALIERMGLAPLTPDLGRAVLVEQFNHILISRVPLPGFRRGIEVFVEKDDLLPFEEAKLYGHNAIHAMIAYLADLRGLDTIAAAGGDQWIMEQARRAFIDESGGAMIRRHARLGDPLFTEAGYRNYAEDLLERMINPNLNDLVERVGRDHARKLAYDDRLFGTMNLTLGQGIEPRRLALGAAAGVLSMIKRQGPGTRDRGPGTRDQGVGSRDALRSILLNLWGNKTDSNRDRLIDLTWEAMQALKQTSR
ncbi:MAG: hypothetical protein WC869_08490 [Phycisphaerae bacterium]|jgi:mannitol-1-phosphate 5-dehydrogenase